jgi:hypothetical protein
MRCAVADQLKRHHTQEQPGQRILDAKEHAITNLVSYYVAVQLDEPDDVVKAWAYRVYDDLTDELEPWELARLIVTLLVEEGQGGERAVQLLADAKQVMPNGQH